MKGNVQNEIDDAFLDLQRYAEETCGSAAANTETGKGADNPLETGERADRVETGDNASGEKTGDCESSAAEDDS